MPAGKTYIKIASYTVPSAVASYTFTNIPQNFTDLVLIASGKVDVASTTKLNVGNNSIDTGSNYSWTVLSGTGSAANSYRESGVTFTQNERYANWDATNTANTIIQIQNYSSGTVYKTWLSKGYNAATGVDIIVGLWRSTSAINQVRISATNATRNLAAGTTLTLYGIECAKSPYATGGDKIYSTGTYWVHEFYNSGLFVPRQNLTVDYLVVAGGGGGGGTSADAAGGGGAGGLRSTVTATGGGGSLESSISVTSSIGYTITVGAGGAGGPTNDTTNGSNGSNSSISGSSLTTITSTGGGGGGRGLNNSGITDGSTGGSGGGGGAYGGLGASGTTNQGRLGGTGGTTSAGSGGGGGGAGNSGNNGGGSGTAGGSGGTGVAVSITGSSITYAGGGGGGPSNNSGPNVGAGGSGGGGGGNAPSSDGVAGTVNTGGGGGAASRNAGGGARIGGSGGSGIVIVRYPI